MFTKVRTSTGLVAGVGVAVILVQLPWVLAPMSEEHLTAVLLSKVGAILLAGAIVKYIAVDRRKIQR